MKIAIMQPYLFPYIAYFQLINAVDSFVIYDDVNFIKQGWINKNSILANGKSNSFVLPLENQSSFKKINETNISLTNFENWKGKFLKTLNQNYAKAPFYSTIQPIVDESLVYGNGLISTLNLNVLKKIANYLTIETKIIESSSNYNNIDLKGSNRVIDICKIEKASNYINLIGGISLYQKSEFSSNGIELNFIQSNEVIYKQFENNFVPNLSIIDVLMFNSPNNIKIMLNNFNLK